VAGALTVALPLLTGCIVGQPRGEGRVLHLRESTTRAGYYLYLPQDYRGSDPSNPPEEPSDPAALSAAAAGNGSAPSAARKGDTARPLVMTFHGMKPFDTAGAQIREWQQEADRYGFVVCAPSLRVPATTSPVPLDRVTAALRRDEAAILAIMDELGRTTDVDMNSVLATSWSYGGYVAHYMVNRHPERFSCLAVKQSNFNADILDDANVPRYRDMPVAVFYTENDFAICRRESQQAGNWYAQRGFDVTFARFAYRGHERTPGPAGTFFARWCGAVAKSPPWEVAFLQVLEPTPLGAAPASSTVLPRLRGAADSALARQGAVPAADAYGATLAAAGDGPLIRIRLSRTIDVAPVLLTYQVSIDPSVAESASVLWMIDAEPVSNGVSGQKVLTAPGDHVVSVLVTDRDGAEYRASEVVTVLERLQEGG